ncbi:MAG: HPF/RaiA family ribosome-associated protein [Candidatus Dojkabacteria bacterium]
MVDTQLTSRNIKLDEDTKSYIEEKISKHSKLLEKATSISVVVDNNRSHRGVKRDFKIEVSVNMPHTFIRVEQKGSNFKEMTDILEQTLKRKLRRYFDQFQRWEKKIPWKVKEINTELEEIQNMEEEDSYADYVPVIKTKQYDDEAPIHPAEAIERMELIGHSSFLFKNIDSGKYSMLYKREDGGYGMVEPQKGT